jgi:hypothetical protein
LNVACKSQGKFSGIALHGYGKKYRIPVKAKNFKAVVPEYSIDTFFSQNGQLILTYGYGKEKKMVIALKKYPR